MRKFLIANLEKGNGTITEDQVIELGGEVTDGSALSQTIPHTIVKYTGSNSFTVEEGLKVQMFMLNGQTQVKDWNQVGNVITYTGTETLTTGDYFGYFGNKAISIADVVTEAGAQEMADATTQLTESRTQIFEGTVIATVGLSVEGTLQSTGAVNFISATSMSIPDGTMINGFQAINLNRLREYTRIESTRPLLNTNFATSALIEGLPQYGKEINLQNTTNIEIAVDSASFQSYFKGGTGNIKFVAGTGRTLKLMEAGKDTINGIIGSFAKVKSFGTVDYIYISNY